MSYLILDIGGSAIKYALMNEDATFIDKGKVDTPKTNKEDLYLTIKSLYDKYENIEGVGISMPGVIDPDKGYTYTSGAINTYNDTYFVKELNEYINVPITIGNDAKCAANAEVGFGVFKDINDGVIIVLGTGIGGCLVKDHKVHVGKHFSAGEASCIITDYNVATDFNYSWSSRNGIKGLLDRIKESTGITENISGIEIFKHINNGEEKYLEGLNQFTFEIAVQIMNIHTWFDCEKVAIGGGISSQPLLIEYINKNIEYIYNEYKKAYYPCIKPEVVKCQFENDANLIGALYQHLESKK